MSKHNFNYLVVTPTNAPNLKPLFSKQGLESLEENFQKIIGFKTEFNEVHLFKRICVMMLMVLIRRLWFCILWRVKF